MRMKLPFLAGALTLGIATPASACNFWFASTHMPIPQRITWGVGAAFELGDYTYISPTGDAAIPLGDKAVVRPAIAICSGEGLSDPFFGAGFAWQLSQNEKMSVNLQTGLSYLPFDGGSEMTIPIGASAHFNRTNPISYYAGASLWWGQVSADGFDSVSDTEPVLFGGLNGRAGSLGWTAGAQMTIGDDTNFALIGGLSFAGGASAIRHIGSLLRK